MPYFESLCEKVGSLAIVIIRFGASSVLLFSLLLAHLLFKKDFWMKNGGIIKFSTEKLQFKIMRREVAMPRLVIYSSLGILFIVALDFFFLMMQAFRTALAIGVTLSLGLPPVATALFEVVFGRFKESSNIWRFAVGVIAAIAGIGAAMCSLQPAVGEIQTDLIGYLWVFGFVITWSVWLIIKSRETQLWSDTTEEGWFIKEVWKLFIIFSAGSAFNVLLLAFVSKLEAQSVLKYFLFIFEYSFGSTSFSPKNFIALSMMVLVSTFFAYLALFWAFAKSSKLNALSILAVVLQTFEPLTVLLFNVFVWHQTLTNLMILGIGLVLISMGAILIVSQKLDKDKNLSYR